MAAHVNIITVMVLLMGMMVGVSVCLPHKPGYQDNSIRRYVNEKVCWWNEICKEEFQSEFRCRCPRWSHCRSPGRYYNAHCSVMASGYIWMQPSFNADPYRYTNN